MSSKEGSVGGRSVSEEDYDRKAEILYRSLKENVEVMSNKMKDCSEIFKDLAKDMDIVNNRMTVLQERSLVTKNATLPEDAISQNR